MNSNLFNQVGYVLMRPALGIEELDVLSHYVRGAAGPATAKSGDPLVPHALAAYADPVLEILLERFLPIVESEIGLKLYPTYSYLRIYQTGDRLPKHKDRPACEISVTLSLGYDPDEPWPLWMESDGKSVFVSLKRGDGLIYKGMEVHHWREVYPGRYAAQAMLHYVNREGLHREWKFDKRPGLGCPQRSAA